MASWGQPSNMIRLLDVVHQALRKLGVIEHDEEPEGTQLASGCEALRGMIRHWEQKGHLAWMETDAWMSLIPGRAVYSFGPEGDFPHRPLEMLSTFVDHAGSDIPLRKVGRQDYHAQSTKNTAGVPNLCYLDPTTPHAKLYVWPIPHVPMGLKFAYRRALYIPQNAKDPFEFPEQWELAIIYNLAALLAPEYGEERPDIQMMADRYLAEIEDATREGGVITFTFDPDYIGGQ